MSIVILNTIRLPEDIWIEHTINTENDETNFKNVETGQTVMRVDSSAYVYDSTKCIGSFRTNEENLWDFICLSSNQDSIAIPNKDLIKAEVRVFKELVSRNVLKVS